MSKTENDEAEKKDSHSTFNNNKAKERREKNAPPSKVVIRKLPPTMTQESFLEAVAPLPDHDYLYFVKGDLKLGQYGFSRAYINFINQEDIYMFCETFDNYVFVDHKGNDFPALVEFAPFQKVPKKVSRKRDSKCGTIETDPDYLNFLEQKEKEATEVEPPPFSSKDALVEIEAKEREMRANHGVLKTSTPLLDYIRQRKEDKIRFREEKKEERRRRETDRRKQREEERRRPKEAPHHRDHPKDGRDKPDRSKVDKTPKQLLTHSKEFHSADKDQEQTKKLKEILKIESAPDRQGQKKYGSSKDISEKDLHQDKDHQRGEHFKEKEKHREKEHHRGDREREFRRSERDQPRGDKDKERDQQRGERGSRSDRAKDREHHRGEKTRERDQHRNDKVRDRDHPRSDRENVSKDHDKDKEHRTDREKDRVKRREDEKARKLTRKPNESSKFEKPEQKGREGSSNKESKSLQTYLENRQKQQDRRKQASVASTSELEKPSTSGADTTNTEPSTSKVVDQGEEPQELSKTACPGEKKEDSVATLHEQEGEKVPPKPKPERIRNKVGMEQSDKGRSIKNKDRPSLQIYRPGMLKKRPTAASGASESGVGGKQIAGQDSASTSASSSPTPSVSGKDGREGRQRASAAPVRKTSLGSISTTRSSKDSDRSDEDKAKEKAPDTELPVKSMTFKRSLS